MSQHPPGRRRIRAGILFLWLISEGTWCEGALVCLHCPMPRLPDKILKGHVCLLQPVKITFGFSQRNLFTVIGWEGGYTALTSGKVATVVDSPAWSSRAMSDINHWAFCSVSAGVASRASWLNIFLFPASAERRIVNTPYKWFVFLKWLLSLILHWQRHLDKDVWLICPITRAVWSAHAVT